MSIGLQPVRIWIKLLSDKSYSFFKLFAQIVLTQHIRQIPMKISDLHARSRPHLFLVTWNTTNSSSSIHSVTVLYLFMIFRGRLMLFI